MKINTTLKKINKHFLLFSLVAIAICNLVSCKTQPEDLSVELKLDEINTNNTFHSKDIKYIPKYNEATAIGNEYISLDCSCKEDGYITAKYLKNKPQAKILLTGENDTTYTYNIFPNEVAVIPITEGNGNYELVVYENIEDTQYAMVFTTNFDVEIANQYDPFLYPNVFVNFTPESNIVNTAAEITKNDTCELEAVADIFEYVITNLSYDEEKATTATGAYVPDIDEILSLKKGICSDYASLMCGMLRSQGIPARMEIGYAKNVYHAWLSVYTKDTGWINGIIQFDGSNWTLMDPTFASNQAEKDFKKFIGDGNNYSTMYKY